MQDFRKLEVWRWRFRRMRKLQLAATACHVGRIRWVRKLKLAATVADRRLKVERGKRFGLTAQVQRAVTSIELNLAEGSSRGTDADFRRFVQMALGSASEVECQLLIARDLEYLSAEKHGEMEVEVQGIKRMLIRSKAACIEA